MTNNEVIERLHLMQERCCNGYDAEAINLTIKAFEERPHGHWIEFKGGYYKCDKCGEVERAIKNFCSRCGADMRGG